MVIDEKGSLSINLTLVAGVNRLGAKTMRNLVTKVDAWMQKKEASGRRLSVYQRIQCHFRASQNQCPVDPAAHGDQQPGLADAGSERKRFFQGKAKVARIIASVEISPEKAAKVIKSVYGDDYPKINSHHLEERLGLSSHLLQAIDSKPKSEDARQEV
jgi:hypothetical protein